MSVLVTGGSGFIGSHVVDKLVGNNISVNVFDIRKPHREDVEFIEGSIVSFEELNAAMKDMKYVFHIAALSNINKVAENPLKAVDLNIMSTTKVLEAARNSDVERVIYASSYFVGSGKGHLYTTTKAASEMLCKDYHTLYGLPFTILRYGTAYGPRSRGEDVISIFVKKALSKQPLSIHGNGNQSRNFIYVEDLAEGNVAALKDAAENKTYNLEGMRPITVKEVGETVKKLIGDVEIEYKEERPGDFEGKVVSPEKAKKELGWEPKVDFEEGVRRYVEWYKEKRKT
ncbi:MAG: NAD-dependent epimerase/dehydratase family protein [Thermoplasmatales archaeon]|nr:NAD-dependent epimerase/dehydratase family protein [Thermoplasmatales archaeon]